MGTRVQVLGMRRALATLAVAFVACEIVMLAVGGWAAVLKTAEIVLPVGALTVLIAAAGDAGKLPLRTMRDRLHLSVGLVVGQLLLVLALAAALMFVSSDDAWTAAGVLVFAAVIGLSAGTLLLRPVSTDVDALRDALSEVERGDRTVRVHATSSGELADVAAAANRMIATLAAEEQARDRADAARRRVVAAVSHDLRTPLSSLRLVAEALEDGLLDEETTRRYLQTMGANVQALGTLIDDLFELSHLDAQGPEWTTCAVPLARLADEVVTMLRAHAERQRILLSTDIASDLAPARANPDKLGRVLLNLLQNAIHNTPPDGSVVISAQQLDDALQIEVADTGGGVPASDRPHIFEPFYRGELQRARTETGSGLGLAISRAIVEAHGGRIWLADGNGGARIRLTVPVAD
jgi:signal transduction histidine kinase